MDDPMLPVPHRRPPPMRAIETVLLASTACLLAAVAWPIASGSVTSAAPSEPVVAAPLAPFPAAESPTIQIAILLDTSSSMDGLIDQARGRIWSVVNSLDSATLHGAKPRFEVALYEYGNDRIDGSAGHLRRVVGFTPELDSVSRALFSLTTNGGSEFAPLAIDRALDELEWRGGDGVIRVVYVAGNESFDQGPAAWRQVLAEAKERGVVVNAIYCGREEDYDATLWRDAAGFGGGRFFAIDQNQIAAYVPAPQDEEIARLGSAINETYIPYGRDGLEGHANQMKQDDNNEMLGMSSVVDRTLTKSSSYYRNPSWDFVDAVDENAVDLDSIDREALPEPLRGLGREGLAAHVAARKAERAAIQERLSALRTEREAFLADPANGAAPEAQGLDSAMITALHEHARASGFSIDPR
ncbi:MAG TPA: vWA domain-containing protein [Nannocystaceae bacterium]|nr:vWA domain-containing protein [Nannocystaceae bacterium]